MEKMLRLRGALAILAGGMISLAPACVDRDSADRADRPASVGSEGGHWALVEDLRLGEVDEGDGAIGMIGSLASDSSGRVFVLDLQAQVVRVYDSTGAFSHLVGRRGQGPGELWRAAGIAVDRTDTLWVIDPGNGRYSLFGPDGDFVRSFSREVRGSLGGWSEDFLPDGRLLDWGLSFPEEGPGMVAGPLIVHTPVAVGRDGSQEVFPSVELRQELAEIRGARVPVPYFQRSVSAALDPAGRLWIARGDPYVVVRRALPGDTLGTIAREEVPAVVDAADRSWVRQGLRNRPDLLDGYLDALPETKPLLLRVVSDRDRILVFPQTEARAAGESLDLFSISGEFLTRLEIPVPLDANRPARWELEATPRGLLMGTLDGIGRPIVVRLRIEEG